MSGAGDGERIFGDDGADEIRANDDRPDVIDCGRGQDNAFFDPGIGADGLREQHLAVTTAAGGTLGFPPSL